LESVSVRVRYVPTELSEGVVEILHDVDSFVVLDDNTVELRRYTSERKYKVVGFLNPTRWASIVDVYEPVDN